MKTLALMLALLFVASAPALAQKSNPAKISANSKTEAKAAPTKPSSNPQYVITVTQGETKLGDITVELFQDLAPKHVANFDSLVKAKFYDGTAFHRVIPGFMIQGGDPNSKSKPATTWGQGDPSQTMVPAEFNKTSHKRGILSAARRGDNINSATSQFFICHADATYLDGQYTVYGQVLSGMEVVDKVATAQLNGSAPVTKITMSIVKKGGEESKVRKAETKTSGDAKTRKADAKKSDKKK